MVYWVGRGFRLEIMCLCAFKWVYVCDLMCVVTRMYLYVGCCVRQFFNLVQPKKTLFFTRLQVISCNKNICTLQITDTTGSHQFPAMQRLSITKGHAFILVYSVCSRQSLEELRPIWSLIKELKVRRSFFFKNDCDF